MKADGTIKLTMVDVEVLRELYHTPGLNLSSVARSLYMS